MQSVAKQQVKPPVRGSCVKCAGKDIHLCYIYLHCCYLVTTIHSPITYALNAYILDLFFQRKELNNSLFLCRADHDRKLPGEHDDTMRNFVLAQALPAVSYQLLVFRRQLLHATSGCNHKTSSSTPLNDQLKDGHSIRGTAQTKLLPIHLQNKVEHQVSNLLI